MSTPIVGAKPLSTDPTKKSAMPNSSTGRRPIVSASFA